MQNMSEHPDTHGLELFIARKLPPDDLLRVARHIGVCQSCRERIAHAERIGARIESLRAELSWNAKSVEHHLDYEQLEAYVDDTLDAVGREIADNHLAVCQPCAREAQELESLREDLTRPRHASNAAAAGLPSTPLWQRFRDSLSLSPRMAWAASLLIIIALAGLLLWQRGRAPEVANDNRRNAPEVVNNNSGSTPGVVNNSNRSLPEVVNNNGVNVNTNNSVVNSTHGSDSVNANRRETARLGSNAAPGVGSAPYEVVIKRALETHSIERAPVLKELAGRPSTLMSGSQNIDSSLEPERATFALLQPVGTVTLSNRPTFNWQPLAGATSYQVHILDTDFNVVAESGQVTTTSWSPPDALKRGVVYLWQVSAAKDGEVISTPAAPAPEARFKILAASKAREVQRAVKERAGSHLQLGIIYAHNGLLDDAEREFQFALRTNQGAATARQLLQNVNGLRR
jgi:anti-sigma factor ChrR (cupin superfamily)